MVRLFRRLNGAHYSFINRKCFIFYVYSYLLCCHWTRVWLRNSDDLTRSYSRLITHMTAWGHRSWTYIHNEEIQPTPGIGEVLDETIGHPFQQHLQNEDVGEDPVSIFQNDPDGLPLFNVHVLEGLGEKHRRLMSTRPKERLKYYNAWWFTFPTNEIVYRATAQSWQITNNDSSNEKKKGGKAPPTWNISNIPTLLM